jgi:hypothetical protein
MAIIVSTAGAVFFDCAPVPARWFADERAFGIFAGPDPLIARSAARHSAGVLVEGTRGFHCAATGSRPRMPDESVHSTPKVKLGFLWGLILGAVCFVISVVVGMNLGPRHNWVFPLLNAIALVLASLLALRKYNESGIARGTVIALSLVFLVNAICGIGWMH